MSKCKQFLGFGAAIEMTVLVYISVFALGAVLFVAMPKGVSEGRPHVRFVIMLTRIRIKRLAPRETQSSVQEADFIALLSVHRTR